MDKYILTKEMGDGSCGIVYKAFNQETNEFVAIKRMKRKFYSWEACTNLREVKSLGKLSHPNIIKLKEVVWVNDELFFVFEFMECNLYQIIRDRQGHLSEVEIRNFMTQFLQGLAYMHRSGYFHRDLKPENLLVTNDLIKIADFGLSREVSSGPPYTDYVSTRWYRAPEVLLRSPSYTPAIDMWAVGAILAELFTSSPLFPGVSEVDQMYKICAVLGTPDGCSWPDGIELFQSISCNCYQPSPADLSAIIPNASAEAIDLIQRLCSWDPVRRPTAEQALRHPFFHVGTWIPNPINVPFVPQMNQIGEDPRPELNLFDFGSQADDCFLGLTLGVKPSIPVADFAGTIHRASGQTNEEILFFPGRLQDNPRQSAHVFEDVQLDLSLLPQMPSRYGEVQLPTIIGLDLALPQPAAYPNSYPTIIESHPMRPVMGNISSPIRECNFFG